MRQHRRWGSAALLLAATLAGCGAVGQVAGTPTPDALATATGIAQVDGTSVAVDDATAHAQATAHAGHSATPTTNPVAATSTPVSTSTAVATSVNVPVPTAAALPYLANFSTWPTTTPTAAIPVRVSYDATTKQYTIAITKANWHQSYIEFLPEGLPFKNFALDVDANQATGESNGDIGVVFDAQPKGPQDKAYVRYNLLLSPGRKLVIVSHTNANDKGTLLGSTPFSALENGKSAHIKLTCRDGKATIAIGGQTVVTYPVPMTEPGAVGLTVVGGNTTAIFSNLRITPFP